MGAAHARIERCGSNRAVMAVRNSASAGVQSPCIFVSLSNELMVETTTR